MEGKSLSVAVRLHPRFDRRHLMRVQLHAVRGHDLDTEELVVAETSDPSVEALDWTPAETGAWRIRMVLVNSLGEESASEPHYIFVQPRDAIVSYSEPEGARFQPHTSNGTSISCQSSKVVYSNAAQYRAEMRAIQRPLIRDIVDDPRHHRLARLLIDGDLSSTAVGSATLGRFGVKAFIFDLDTRQRIQFVEFVAPPDKVSSRDYFGAFSVQISDDPEARYSFTSSDLVWHTVRRVGHARVAAPIRFNSANQFRIYLPVGTEARLVRVDISFVQLAGWPRHLVRVTLRNAKWHLSRVSGGC